MNKIVWLTGPSGAGKTTTAERFSFFNLGWIILDGDEMRESISLDAGFSRKDRTDHNWQVYYLDKLM